MRNPSHATHGGRRARAGADRRPARPKRRAKSSAATRRCAGKDAAWAGIVAGSLSRGSRRLPQRGHDKIRSMRIAIPQLDCVVGDLAGNAARLLGAVTEARRGGADLVITPELSLCGYPPEDLVLRPAFLEACADELSRLAAEVSGTTVLIGYPEAGDRKPHNAVAVVRDR